MRLAAREGDTHSCPLIDRTSKGDFPHRGGYILAPCSPSVIINGKAAARAGDELTCRGDVNRIEHGSATVRINGLPAARIGDPTSHGGDITSGAGTVFIG
jgi:uncharacterized Zn-binding protein involved in type VI secretion